MEFAERKLGGETTMSKLKKLIAAIGLIISLVVSTNLTAEAQTTVTVGVIGDSTHPIWEIVQENLGEEIQIELVSFTDGIYTNQAQADGDLDLTAFQHNAFLNNEIADKGYELTAIGNTIISPMNIYSEKIADISELSEGDQIIIPNNVTNMGRALIVLDRAGLITVDPDKGFLPDITDITDNPLNLEIVEADPALIPQSLPDVAAGITNSDLAIDFGINPVEDAIFALDIDPDNKDLLPYINIIVARTEDVENEIYLKIVEAYQQENVSEFILEHYGNAMIPAW